MNVGNDDNTFIQSSVAVLANQNKTQAINATLHFLRATTKNKLKETGRIYFNNIFYLTRYIKNIFILTYSPYKND